MGRSKKYGNIILKDGDREILEKIARSQTAEYRKVQCAKIILYSADGMSNTEIGRTPLQMRKKPGSQTLHAQNSMTWTGHRNCGHTIRCSNTSSPAAKNRDIPD